MTESKPGSEKVVFEQTFAMENLANDYGTYASPRTRTLFQGWQASRLSTAKEIADWLDTQSCSVQAALIRERYGLTPAAPEGEK